LTKQNPLAGETGQKFCFSFGLSPGPGVPSTTWGRFAYPPGRQGAKKEGWGKKGRWIWGWGQLFWLGFHPIHRTQETKGSAGFCFGKKGGGYPWAENGERAGHSGKNLDPGIKKKKTGCWGKTALNGTAPAVLLPEARANTQKKTRPGRPGAHTGKQKPRPRAFESFDFLD